MQWQKKDESQLLVAHHPHSLSPFNVKVHTLNLHINMKEVPYLHKYNAVKNVGAPSLSATSKIRKHYGKTTRVFIPTTLEGHFPLTAILFTAQISQWDCISLVRVIQQDTWHICPEKVGTTVHIKEKSGRLQLASVLLKDADLWAHCAASC